MVLTMPVKMRKHIFTVSQASKMLSLSSCISLLYARGIPFKVVSRAIKSPYTRSFAEDDPAGKTVLVDDLKGMSAKEAEKQLKNLGLTAKFVGSGETVTGQIPGQGEQVPGGSQILLYLDEVPEQQQVEMPDFKGLHRQQAADLAGSLGLYILISGNQEISPTVTVQSQSVPPGTMVDIGSTVQLDFVDTKVSD